MVQQRLGVLYAVLSAVILGLWGISVASLLSNPGIQAISRLTTVSRIGHLAIGLVLLAAAGLCRRKAQIAPTLLGSLDVVASLLVSLLAAVSIAAAPPGVHVELMPVVAYTLVATARAALVPTLPRWTAVVAVISAIPVPFGTWVAVQSDASWSETAVPRLVFLVVACAWVGAAALCAMVIASVVHGLHKRAEHTKRIGPYTLEEKIGEGGMGVVYRARHALLRRPTAIKLLAANRTDAASVWRFEREARTTSCLTHPNTVAVYDFGRTPSGTFYYAMELLNGVTLERLVEQEGRQPARRVTHILLQIAGALAEAHDAGLVHRDVKPSNVFLCERRGAPDFVKVLDFGLVKDLQTASDPALSHDNAVKGTPLYLPPESILAPETLGPTADLYALGAVGYFLLTGRPPFRGKNVFELCTQHLYATPVPPSELLEDPGCRPLERVLLRCLAKSPDDRPATAGALVAELRAALDALPVPQPDALPLPTTPDDRELRRDAVRARHRSPIARRASCPGPSASRTSGLPPVVPALRLNAT